MVTPASRLLPPASCLLLILARLVGAADLPLPPYHAVPGCVLWLDAAEIRNATNGQSVSTWVDAAHGQIYGYAASGQAPRWSNSPPALWFDGVDDTLNLTNGAHAMLAGARGITIFTVLKSTRVYQLNTSGLVWRLIGSDGSNFLLVLACPGTCSELGCSSFVQDVYFKPKSGDALKRPYFSSAGNNWMASAYRIDLEAGWLQCKTNVFSGLISNSICSSQTWETAPFRTLTLSYPSSTYAFMGGLSVVAAWPRHLATNELLYLEFYFRARFSEFMP